MFNNQLKKNAIQELKRTESNYNQIAVEGNDLAMSLYALRKSAVLAIERVEKYINTLANTPKEFQKEIAEVILNIKEFREAVRIEKENASDNIKAAGVAGGSIAAGGTVAGLGPSAAMVIATTFGKASTGVAICNLSGAAATNAALAWLGGGTLAAGGGGMAAGQALLALAGPIGWGIAGLGLVGGGLIATNKNKKAAEEAVKLNKELLGKIAALRPRVERLRYLNKETERLKSSLNIAEFNLFPNDYDKFNEAQKMKLAALVNNTKSMGVLINQRVS